MKYKELIWVSGFASIFFFLPSLTYKIWNFFLKTPWQIKKFTLYGITGMILIYIIRRQLGRNKIIWDLKDDHALLWIAKRRLVEGEISLEEYRQIKQEIQ